MVQLIPPRKLVTLPESQRQRLEEIRDGMVDDVAAAIERLDPELRELARQVADEVRSAQALPARMRAQTIRAAIGRFYAASDSAISRVGAQQLLDAAQYAERYSAILDHYRVRERHQLPEKPAAGEMKTISDYDAWWLSTQGEAQAETALRYGVRGDEARQAAAIRAQGRRAAAREGITPPVTKGDSILQRHAQPFPGVADISERLHGTAAVRSGEATRSVLRTIRESESLDEAARELQRVMGPHGGVGAKAKMPRLVADLEKRARALAHSADDPELAKAFRAQVRKARKYARGLAESGTVQSGYFEVLDDLTRKAGRGRLNDQAVDKAVEKWSYWKQRYNAERIVRTETAAAYRSRSLESDMARPWIVGYRWRMFASFHAAFKRRKPSRLKRFGGAHCICEVMAGEVLSPAVARQYPRMGHPHCVCYLEPVIELRAMLEAPITDEELASV